MYRIDGLALAISFDAWRRQEGKKARIREQVACTCATDAVQGASAPVPPVPAPLPHAPAVEGDWHTSAAYRALADAFGA